MNIGVDLVKIERLENILDNLTGDKIFTAEEKQYISLRNNDSATIAGMFAAKEATLKALKKGLDGARLTDIIVKHDNYAPTLSFDGKLKKEIEEHKLKFSVSISHDGEYAIASVISYL